MATRQEVCIIYIHICNNTSTWRYASQEEFWSTLKAVNLRPPSKAKPELQPSNCWVSPWPLQSAKFCGLSVRLLECERMWSFMDVMNQMYIHWFSPGSWIAFGGSVAFPPVGHGSLADFFALRGVKESSGNQQDEVAFSQVDKSLYRINMNQNLQLPLHSKCCLAVKHLIFAFRLVWKICQQTFWAYPEVIDNEGTSPNMRGRGVIQKVCWQYFRKILYDSKAN